MRVNGWSQVGGFGPKTSSNVKTPESPCILLERLSRKADIEGECRNRRKGRGQAEALTLLVNARCCILP